MLFWEALQCNKRFRSFIIGSDSGHKFLILVLYYALEYKSDPTKQGVVRMCAFVLQTLSTEIDFGKRLNEPYHNQDSLLGNVRIESFEGTYADYTIVVSRYSCLEVLKVLLTSQSIYILITTSQGKLDAIYPSLLATINNIAPCLKHLSVESSTKLLQLFTSMSAPGFLLANESNHRLLESLLESMNAIIEHQYTQSPNFIRAVLKSKRRFDNLRSFTLEGGQEEIERQAQRRKDTADPATPATPRHGSSESTRVRIVQEARLSGMCRRNMKHLPLATTTMTRTTTKRMMKSARHQTHHCNPHVQVTVVLRGLPQSMTLSLPKFEVCRRKPVESCP